MPAIDKVISQVAGEVSMVLKRIDHHEAEGFARRLLEAERIFVLGEGRSGLMGKAFAMRLMHAGFTVYVVGETITPSIKAGDLLIALSGSGNTPSIREAADKGKKAGANLLVVTTQPDSKDWPHQRWNTDGSGGDQISPQRGTRHHPTPGQPI